MSEATKGKAEGESKFVYVTYIRTTREKLWDALTKAEFTKQYWFDCAVECEWKAGAKWSLTRGDVLMDVGEVVEAERPNRIVLKWRNELRPELKAEGFGRATFELTQAGEAVKLVVTHEMALPRSKYIMAVGSGWPMVLSNLKSLLETGSALKDIAAPPKAAGA